MRRKKPSIGEREVLLLVHPVDEVLPAGLDRLALEGELVGELAVLLVERAGEDLERHHPLEGRQEAVRARHQRREQLAELLGRPPLHRGGLVVGPDEQRVVLAVIADQERLRDRLEVAEQVLHPLRRDGLALAVLVDLLLPAGDAEVPGRVNRHEVAGAEPALGVGAVVARARAEVAGGDVGAADRSSPSSARRHSMPGSGLPIEPSTYSPGGVMVMPPVASVMP